MPPSKGRGSGASRVSPVWARADCQRLPQQMEFLGRHLAWKLNINYFDCLGTSYRHVVRHWPLEASFSPGIVLRKTRAYHKPSSQYDLDV